MQNVIFSWEGDVSALYDFQYKKSGDATWQQLPNSPTQGVSVSIPSLEDATDYDFRVRANGKTSDSAWVYYRYKTAAVGCSGSTSVSVSGISQTAANVSWSVAGTAVNGYIVQWKKTTQLNWKSSPTTTAPFFTITGLSAGAEYQVKIVSICAYGGTADSAGVNFTTLSTSSLCSDKSIGIVDINEGLSSYTVSWVSSGQSAPDHIIEYSLNGTSWLNVTPTSKSLTSAVYIIPGTFPQTHTLRITPKCSDTSLGTSGTFVYTAPPDPVQYVNFKNTITGGTITSISIDGSPNVLTSPLTSGDTKKYNQTGLLAAAHNAQAYISGVTVGTKLTIRQIRNSAVLTSGFFVYQGPNVPVPLSINQTFQNLDTFEIL